MKKYTTYYKIEAIQWKGDNIEEIKPLCDSYSIILKETSTHRLIAELSKWVHSA